MPTAALTLTVLAMSAGQVANDIYYSNQKSYMIPVELPPAGRQMISQLRLYASTDQGRSWQQADVITPDKNNFYFQAKIDGLYWFRVAVVNLQGRQEPENIYQGPPDQKMVVDTVKPIIEITGQRQGDDILARWNIQEDHPDMQALKLDWRAKDVSPTSWNAVPHSSELRGQAKFRVQHAGATALRFEVRDRAGNVSIREVDVYDFSHRPQVSIRQAPNDVFITNQKHYRIPIQQPADAKQSTTQIRLFASTDQGLTWQRVDAITPDKDSFEFQARRDGPHWFRLAAVNLQGRQEPENVNQGPPDQKMIVDTIKPTIIELSGKRIGNSVLVHWNVYEDHPDMQSMKLDWRVKAEPLAIWSEVTIDRKLRGHTQFPGKQAGIIVLRLQVRDLAGNAAFREIEVSVSNRAP